MKTTNHPQWALDQKKPGTELRLIRGKYYLYEYKTVYDQSRKGPKKISGKLLGSITEKGFVPSKTRMLEKRADSRIQSKPDCKEFGVSLLVYKGFEKYLTVLEKHFPLHWKQLVVIAYCRLIYRCPLKSIPFRLNQSFLQEFLDNIKFNEKTATGVLKSVGEQHEAMLSYMRSFIAQDEYLLMDLTHVFSNSELLSLSRSGYNNQMNFDPQINLLYLYSSKSNMPVYYRVLPGNIREVKAFKNALAEAGLNDAVIVADKGFYSKKNIDLMQQESLKFILPLKRDNVILDYTQIEGNTFKQADSYFEHEKRFIWYQKYPSEELSLFVYIDESLKVKEEKDYLRRIETHPENYSLQGFHQKRNTFGTLALLTNFQFKTGKDVYETYKSRQAIEVTFDGMNNVMEADHTYMQDDHTLYGWMFVNHLTLQWYQHLYLELKDKNLLKSYSVNDYIQMLTDLKKIRINDKWYLNEITNHAQKMIGKIGLSIEEYNT